MPEEFTPRVRDATHADALQLAWFDCGGTDPCEVEVNEIFKKISHSDEVTRGEVRVRIAEHPKTKLLVGASAYHRDPIPMHILPQETAEPGIYVPALGITAQFREGFTTPGGISLGRHMLTDLLHTIQTESQNGMPLVWSVVAPENTRCHRLITKHGFSPIRRKTSEHTTWVRPDGMPL